MNARAYVRQVGAALRKTLRVQKNPMGIDGDVAECRFMHDAFVLGTKANGLYVDVAAASVQANPTIAKSSSTWTITSANATAIKYTTDGTDPKTSGTAQTYSEALSGLTSGTVIKAYASKAGVLNSGVTEFVV